MKHVYKTTTWLSASGKYHCGDLSDLGNNSNLWWYPCRILGISPSDFVLLLYTKFNCKNISFTNDSMTVLSYSWDSEKDAKSWSKFINSQAAKIKFSIG